MSWNYGTGSGHGYLVTISYIVGIFQTDFCSDKKERRRKKGGKKREKRKRPVKIQAALMYVGYAGHFSPV